MTAVAVSTTTLPPAFVGESYEASFAFSTVDAVVTLSAGTTQTNKDALPASLSYTANGRITGTPAAGDEGVYNLSIKFTGAGTDTALDNQAFTLHVYASRDDAAFVQDGSVAEQVAQRNLA